MPPAQPAQALSLAACNSSTSPVWIAKFTSSIQYLTNASAPASVLRLAAAGSAGSVGPLAEGLADSPADGEDPLDADGGGELDGSDDPARESPWQPATSASTTPAAASLVREVTPHPPSLDPHQFGRTVPTGTGRRYRDLPVCGQPVAAGSGRLDGRLPASAGQAGMTFSATVADTFSCSLNET